MVALTKPGSVVVDLAAEQGGNCDSRKKIKLSKAKMALKLSAILISKPDGRTILYPICIIRHMLDDLTRKRRGINVNMEDDVIRGATVVHRGEVTFPPLRQKFSYWQATQTAATPELTPEEKAAAELAKERAIGRRQAGLLVLGGLFMLLVGAYAPSSFMQHFIVFALSCFVGFQVIWNVSHALHTPLMAVTNAISGIIIIGALLQIGSPNGLVEILAGISVLIATINIVGGFMVTRRMLAMFQKS